jgi:hypothetical protein
VAGNVVKRFGFHCFRHTLASFLLAQGNNPVLIKNLLRWSKISMLDVYGHVMTDEKIAAQGSMLERIMPKTNAVQYNGCRTGAHAMKSSRSRAMGRAEKPMNTGERNGRHDWTRTSDLYRVNSSSRSLTQKELIAGGTGRTVILGAICHQIATKNMASGFGAESWGIGPITFALEHLDLLIVAL